MEHEEDNDAILGSLNPIDNMTLELLMNRRQYKHIFNKDARTIYSISSGGDITLFQEDIQDLWREFLGRCRDEEGVLENVPEELRDIYGDMNSITYKIIEHLKRKREIEATDNGTDEFVLFRGEGEGGIIVSPPPIPILQKHTSKKIHTPYEWYFPPSSM